MATIDRINGDAIALAAAKNGNWTACAERLNATATSIRKPIEQSRYTWVGLQKALGDELFKTIRTKLGIALRQLDKAATEAVAGGDSDLIELAVSKYESIKSLYDALSSGQGPSFADDQTQANINSLSTLLNSDEIESLKALGFNVKLIVTADECEIEWTNYENNLLEKKQIAARSAIVTTLRRLANRFESESMTVNNQLRTEIVDEIDANWPEI